MPPRKASGSRQRVGQVASPVPSSYPGLINGTGMEEEKWQACKEMLEGVYKAKHGTRKLADIFRELPDRELYADYYEAIPEPECLDNIATQLVAQTYLNPESFFKQLHLVFLNAKHSGIFTSPDPYHSSPVKPGRKSKRATSAIPSQSSTPLPEPVKASTPLPAPLTEPPKSETPASAPPGPVSAPHPQLSPPPPPTLTPAPMIRTRSESQSRFPAVSPTSSEKSRQRNQNDADKKIMAARDATLPRWQGPQAVLPGASTVIPGSGWFGEGAPDYEKSAGGPSMWPHRMRTVLGALAGYRGPSLRDFDFEMSKLFEKGRRWFPDGSPEYGKVLILQRLYNALTAPYPMTLPPSGIPAPSPTLFASLPAGPGNARSLHETTQELRAGAAEEEVGFGITTFRVGTKDRVFTEEARHKGMSYRVADRMFFEREVFKTGHFCDHPVEDILEKISVQFYVKYIRGRPRPGEYYPGWPLFKSPFLLGVAGPGFIGEPRKAPGGGGEEEEDDEEEKQPKRRERVVRPPPPSAATVAPPTSMTGPSRVPTFTPTPTPAPPTPPVYRPNPPPPVTAFPSRTVAAIMGGPQVMEQVAIKETLPLDTGPPLAPGTISIPQPQAHSVEYLSYMTKRKLGDNSAPTKRAKREVPQSASLQDSQSEDFSKVWWAEGQSSEQIVAGLQALINHV
ncbi:hypothetical protein IAR55_004542 [Kwoniella newhampshirensis]|uniref:Bromo domain-containing protein n=1 Tax=Kwoniella newhampshirensis TaxID=1651941 RepID=A0AAW0YXH6_9TREE